MIPLWLNYLDMSAGPVTDKLRSSLQSTLQQMLQLIELAAHDEVIGALEAIIDRYSIFPEYMHACVCVCVCIYIYIYIYIYTQPPPDD